MISLGLSDAFVIFLTPSVVFSCEDPLMRNVNTEQLRDILAGAMKVSTSQRVTGHDKRATK
jgi:hypothetical protein